MMKLSKKNLVAIGTQKIDKPAESLLDLPEKVLQFGTGVLLRGLCDYVVHDANTKGLFNGRIVVVKSTDAGDTVAFNEQDNLYTICVRGVDNEKIVEENIICSAISRVLSAKQQWHDVLKTMHDPQMQVIISNTTEAGLQLVKEKIKDTVPQSFPAKLLAVLVSRYEYFKHDDAGKIVVIPTELISDNGKVLKSIIDELVQYNSLGEDFITWLNQKVFFCNSLVDRIVTKDPGEQLLRLLQDELGYNDDLLTMCEDYALWAIEGSPEVENILAFTRANNGAFVKPEISVYKFLKLHLLNGTHTLSASLAFLAGFDIVKEGMNDPLFSAYVSNLQQNIAVAIPYKIADSEIQSFSKKVLDRFRNPFLQHKWLNITLQNTMKMRNRNVPVIERYHHEFNKAPVFMATGFAGYLLFMKGVKKEGAGVYGVRNNEPYLINDEHASYFYDVWSRSGSPADVVDTVLSNETLWGMNLLHFTPFAESVKQKLSSMITNGVRNTISNI